MMKEIHILENETETVFYTSKELVKGLLYTDNLELINRNIVGFGIEFDESIPKGETLSNISKRGTYAIITLKFDSKSQSQYLISKDLDLKKVESLSDNVISKPFKALISKAFQMTQASRTLGDFFK